MRFLILSLAVFYICLGLFGCTDARNLDTKMDQSNDKAFKIKTDDTNETPLTVKHESQNNMKINQTNDTETTETVQISDMTFWQKYILFGFLNDGPWW